MDVLYVQYVLGGIGCGAGWGPACSDIVPRALGCGMPIVLETPRDGRGRHRAKSRARGLNYDATPCAPAAAAAAAAPPDGDACEINFQMGRVCGGAPRARAPARARGSHTSRRTKGTSWPVEPTSPGTRRPSCSIASPAVAVVAPLRPEEWQGKDRILQCPQAADGLISIGPPHRRWLLVVFLNRGRAPAPRLRD